MNRSRQLSNYFLFILIMISLPAQAMWRQSAQKISAGLAKVALSGLRATEQHTHIITDILPQRSVIQKIIPEATKDTALRLKTIAQPQLEKATDFVSAQWQRIATQRNNILIALKDKPLLSPKGIGSAAIGAGAAVIYTTNTTTTDFIKIEDPVTKELQKGLTIEELNKKKFYSSQNFLNKYSDNPQAIAFITKLIVNNISTITNGIIVDEILEINPSAPQQFAKAIEQNDITTINPEILNSIYANDKSFACFIDEVLAKKKGLRGLIAKIPLPKRHTFTLTPNKTTGALKELTIEELNQKKDFWLYKPLQNYLNKYSDDPHALAFITELVANNISSVTNNQIIDQILKINPKAIHRLTKAAAENIDTINDQIFWSIKRASQSDLLLIRELILNDKNLADSSHDREKESMAKTYSTIIKTLSATKKRTITEQHMIYTTRLCGSFYFTHFLLNKTLENDIIKDEKALQDKHYTLYHAQRWHYLLNEKTFTDLWGIHRGKKIKDFLFTHLKDPNTLAENNKEYKSIMQRGRKDFNDLKTRSNLLFLNAPLFGNKKNWGSSTAYYFNDNVNCHNIPLSLADIFKLYGDIDIYNKYKKPLEKLEREYQELNKKLTGNILLFAIPKKIAKKYIFLASPGGYKKSITINGKETDDLDLIMNAYKNNPTSMSEIDRNEFCMVMLGKAIDPSSGIKVKAFNNVPPKEMALFWKKYETIMNNIRADIKAKNRRKNFKKHCETFSPID